MVVIVLACALLAAGRAGRETQVVPPSDIRCWMGASQSGPAQLRLSVGPRRGDGRWVCEVLAWNEPGESLSSGGKWHPASGRVLLRADGARLETGSRIDATGRCRTGLGRDNRLVTLEVFHGRHIWWREPPPPWRRWIEAVRGRVRDVLSASPLLEGHHQSLVSAIVLGRRDGMWNEIAAPFRATGTAHLLAVSGLHLAVLCGFVLAASRWFGSSVRRGSVMAVVATATMLLVADIRTPLARAGIMVLVAAGFSTLRWRMSAGTVLATAAIAIEIDHPRAVVDIGFQLSFAVVAALIYVFPAWSRRVSVAGIPRSPITESIRATTTAWLIATPIAAHHFGMYSLLGIPATLLLFPMIAGILAIGYLRILMSVWAMASDASGHVLNAMSSLLWGSVLLLDQVPGSGLEITTPSWAWVLAAELAGIGIMLSRRRLVGCISLCGLVLLWLAASVS